MKKYLAIFLLLLLSNLSFGQKLVWNRNSEKEVIGYLVYIGYGSATYDIIVDVKNDTFMVIDPRETRTRFFAVKAYTADTTSGFSSEVMYSALPTINCDCNRDGFPTYTLDFALLRKFIGVKKYNSDGSTNSKWALNHLENYDFNQDSQITALDRGLFQKLCKR